MLERHAHADLPEESGTPLPRVLLAALERATVLGGWLALGFTLSRLTGRVADWFVMTDELLYERLAISIAETGSPLPRVREELVSSFNQLYPLVLAPVFRDGLVPEALHEAHVLNAFVMSSVAVPAYLLARDVAGSRVAAAAVGVLSVCVPWIVLSSFLLTEVVAYPAFAWACLAMHRAVAAPSPHRDAVALAALAVAAAARVQFLVLLLVLPLAVVLVERAGPRRLAAAHPVLAAAYGVLAVAAVAWGVVASVTDALGSYAITAQGDLLSVRALHSAAASLASLSLALAVLPLLVALAWALATVVHRRGERREQAFAGLAIAVVALLSLEVGSYGARFGSGLVQDRYLFHVVPVVLVALAAALRAPAWPRAWALAPAAVLAAGFARHPLQRFEKLNVDSPAAVAHGTVLDLFESPAAARAGLVLAVVVGALLLLQARTSTRRRGTAALAVVLVAVSLPSQTAQAFARLFAVNGTSGRPVTLDQGVVFNWVDRRLGREADVTMVPYPTAYGDYWAGVAFWWDLEFWNVSVARAAYQDDAFASTPSTFPKLELGFDPRTGVASASPTRYVAQYAEDARFRLAGPALALERNTLLVDAGAAWRAEWISRGLYADGWTRPGRAATIRVFPAAGQHAPVTRSLALYVRSPGNGVFRRVRVVSGRETAEAEAGEDAVHLAVRVCVRPGGFAEVRVETDGHSPVLGDLTSLATVAEPREAGVLLKQISLADEVVAGCG